MKIVALSDQHGFLPEIPPCDLLIVGGDVCPDRPGPSPGTHHPERQKSWFDLDARRWLANAPATHRVLTWGNHDFCGQAYSFSDDSPQQASTTDLQILVDEGTRVPVDGADGAVVTLWATPWSNAYLHWAFMKDPEKLAAIYAAIPEGIDILVSHQPPFGYGDQQLVVASGKFEQLGSRELLATLDRVRPKLVVCGHIHAAHGLYEYRGMPIYNVAVCDARYQLARPVTLIDFA